MTVTNSGPRDVIGAEPEGQLPPAEAAEGSHPRNSSAAQLARTLAWVPGQRESRVFRDRCRILIRQFQPLLAMLERQPAKLVSEDLRCLRDNLVLLEGELVDTCKTLDEPEKIPQVRTHDGEVIPRIAALAEDFLTSGGYEFSEAAFVAYIQSFQEVTVLKMAELWLLIAAMKLVLLEKIVGIGRQQMEGSSTSCGMPMLFRALQDIRNADWKSVIEPLILFDHVLREDPADAYARMEYDSRELYRKKLAAVARRCDCSEVQVASAAVALARQVAQIPVEDPRMALRRSHVGFYLLAEGRLALEKKVGFDPSIGQRLRNLLLKHPDEFYLPGIAILTFAIVSGAVLAVTQPNTALGYVLLATLTMLLLSSQSAVQIMNYMVTLMLPAEILPKLDFSDGLPADCVTLVAIPTVLMNEKQVHKLVEDLEVRYLGNQSPNLHFALLSDLSDSPAEPREDSPLVDLASDLIRKLNEQYGAEGKGSFFLFHRHRIYNPRERLWMGWERKRGKLMDLNNLLRAQFDSFPHKVGDLSILPSVRFVITLDSDTELPRGSASRMVGTLAHPLNQAIIDPHKGIVVAGYGILQPRVGVSVQSTARSRLASIYSGQTGLDIYTRAISDVYQDLYGEGIFVGKGIYEVETLHRVLHGRFPRNALLSHDLIEGAYTRAGLVTDIEVIEDYPSHYSAHNRRKHRWLRGDWQITEWLLETVPEESGRKVPNPLSMVSRWKILDNLRRSLVEPALFLLFLLAWLWLPGRASAWTLATIAILFLPALCQFAFDLAQAAALRKRVLVLDAFDSLLSASIANWLTVTFLAHQALLAMDAVVRTMVRRLITRQKLLEWETAAEAEISGDKRTMLDIYLNWTPVLALGVFFLVWLVHRSALPAALPILLLWAGSKPISLWLNRPPRAPRKPASERDRWLLRISALRTWRYFLEFSTEEHHWLIPDNIQGEDDKVAARISPTNLGLLLNARQVAVTFGYLTVPEFAQQTLLTLGTVSRLQKHRGHLLNWYDTRTLVVLPPAVVSSVDSGNLVASLWTLQEGCLAILDRPFFQRELAEGVLDGLYLLTSFGALRRRKFSGLEKELRRESWLESLLAFPDGVVPEIDVKSSGSEHAAEAEWFREHLRGRIRQVQSAVGLYAPWLQPEFSGLKGDPAIGLPGVEDARLEEIPALIDRLTGRLESAMGPTVPEANNAIYGQLLGLLPQARSNAVALIADLKAIAAQASGLADEMDFGFLLNRSRGLLSVSFEVESNFAHSYCYDLLASEARTASFVAIAKGDIPQESWFRLGRSPVLYQGTAGLLSWTGTMFEYLMPTVWMRTYPNTLLERASEVAVRMQQAYAAEKGVLWGISESACARLDDCGNYVYFAFGVPALAIQKKDQDGPVVSPYSTFLALAVDGPAALRNLRKMQHKRWLGHYGFYEALDFSADGHSAGGSEVVRCWMAHHQGMSLLALANFLYDDVVQDWFHAHPRVQATERLLQEKPAGRQSPQRVRPKVA